MEKNLKVYKKGTDIYVNESKVEVFEVGGYFGIHLLDNITIEIGEGFKEVNIIKGKLIKIKK